MTESEERYRKRAKEWPFSRCFNAAKDKTREWVEMKYDPERGCFFDIIDKLI